MTQRIRTHNTPRRAVYDRIAAQLERERDGDTIMRRQIEVWCRRCCWSVRIETDDEAGVSVEIRGPGVEDLRLTRGAGFRIDDAPEKDTLDALASIGEAIIAAVHRAHRYGLADPWREVAGR